MWKLTITDGAEFDLQKIGPSDRQRIVGRLRWLVENFGIVKPVALAGELRGFFKFRIGGFRAIYTVEWNDKIILVHAIGKRDDIYKTSF